MRRAVVLALVLLLATPALAHTQRPPEHRLAHMIRTAREVRDLSRAWHGDRLHRFGRRQVERMIDCRCVQHAAPPVKLCPKGWGQAVGVGTTVREVFGAFMASPVHRDILLAPGMERIGVGARRAGGLVYVAVELCR